MYTKETIRIKRLFPEINSAEWERCDLPYPNELLVLDFDDVFDEPLKFEG